MNSLSLPDNLPEVIQDAMEVTLRLGERCLWVDKYCIDHHNPTREKAEIAAMDLIPEQAQVTIFAAAGLDQKFGLLGVNGGPREKQAIAHINGVQLASTLTYSMETVKSSKWYSKGWAHQEAVLSHRRLFFYESISANTQQWVSLTLCRTGGHPPFSRGVT